MATVVGPNPYDLADLLKGPCRFLWLPYAKTAPTKLSEIIEVEGGEYKPKNEWLDLGATAGGGSYSRQFSTAGYEIEQTTGNVDEDVTDAARTITGQFAQLDETFLSIMEGGGAISTVAAAAGYSAEKHVSTGTITSLPAYRIAVIARRGSGLGVDVAEKTGGIVRGAMVAYVMWRGKITADQAAVGLAKGQLSSAQLSFQAYPESGKAQGKEHGDWILEQAGTIT